MRRRSSAISTTGISSSISHQVVPWPYPENGAETFIARELEKVAAGEEIYNWMLVLRGGDGEAIGNIRFRPGSDDAKGNRGFWLAERYWNQGLMSEAVSAVNDFAFRTLGIECFYACNAATNVASRRVKQKTGAELVGYIELAHHSGQTLAEKWRVTRENWLRPQVRSEDEAIRTGLAVQGCASSRLPRSQMTAGAGSRVISTRAGALKEVRAVGVETTASAAHLRNNRG